MRQPQERTSTERPIYDIPLTNAEVFDCTDGDSINVTLRVPLIALANAQGAHGVREFIRSCVPTETRVAIARCDVVGHEPAYTGDDRWIRGYVHLRVHLYL